MDNKKKYKETLEKARKELQACGSQDCDAARQIFRLFPELVESEDEKIRKKFIMLVKMSSEVGGFALHKWEADEMLAWLEKQGEQKSVDKVEPKFKVGDWVVLSTSDGEKVVQIDSVEYFKSGGPRYITSEGRWFGNGTKAHLWTIQDAKDGDVLAYVTDEEDLWIMIYWSLYEPYEGHVHYHALLVNDNFGDKGTCCICIDNLKPATKEQRDLLFQRMKESEYMWDTEKKELKLLIDFESENCKQKPACSEDETSIAIMNPEAYKIGFADGEAYAKEEMQSSWSEEDEKILKPAIAFLSEYAAKGYENAVMCIDWLNSIKKRMGGINYETTVLPS